MITLRRFGKLEQAVKEAGFESDTIWAEQLGPPVSAEQFASEAVYVILNSGMKNTIAISLFERCMDRLRSGKTVRRVFRHSGKARAISTIWKNRQQLFANFSIAEDKVEFCASLPWIGPVTSYHLAKYLGVDLPKPDVHLVRIARRDRMSVDRLCRRLANLTGYRIATVDTILWRACEQGILNSRRYEADGWRAAFRTKLRD